MGTGIKTNGVGKRFDGHLNFTVTLAADVKAETDRKDKYKPRKMGRPPGPNLTRPRFAGDDRYEGSAQ